MTCIEAPDIDVLEKYEPYGLVMYKMSKYSLCIPAHILGMHYDLYQNILSPIVSKIERNDDINLINIEQFKTLIGINR